MLPNPQRTPCCESSFDEDPHGHTYCPVCGDYVDRAATVNELGVTSCCLDDVITDDEDCDFCASCGRDVVRSLDREQQLQ